MITGLAIITSLLVLAVACEASGEGINSPDVLIRQFRPPLPPVNAKVEYEDLNGDGNPEVLRTTMNGFPVQWISDDGTMRHGDVTGNCVNCCLMVDRNRDGDYGGAGDLIVQWIDTDGDGKADMQIIADNADGPQDKLKWGPGHYMIVIDTDHDGVFNYIDWKDMKVKCWEHSGQCRFYTDYIGQSMFLKAHTDTSTIADLRYNWENPFLFYDPDHDGLTEMAIRLCDPPVASGTGKGSVSLTKKITLAAMAFDVDNGSAPGNEFDYDMSIGFWGPGFDYQDQVHKFKWKRCVEADKYFRDPRFRQLTELIYPDHGSAWDLIFHRGKWDRISFVFDEDHDCKRWERVEFYDSADMFKIGVKNGGLDSNGQSDATGDRGEWDLKARGGGKLYIGRFDGRIHLYGADWGAWRIDQDAAYFQGWSRSANQPSKFATVKYSDTNGNGFIDTIEYDLDGDTVFEQKVSLAELGIDDKCDIVDTSKQGYAGLHSLYEKAADGMWKRAEDAMKVAHKAGLELTWYAALMQPKSIREKDQFGYWLQFYIYQDLRYMAMRNKDDVILNKIDRAYFSGNWKLLGV